MTPSQLLALKATLRTSEGWVPWLYLDTARNATVGCGHLVRNYHAALQLPFAPMMSAREWAAVTSAPKGMRADAYRIDSTARLSDADIEALLDADIAAVQAALARKFRGYASWPAPADAAMCDVGFNCGGSLTGFPRLVAAACIEDWGRCAVECHRVGIADSRSERTSDLFRQAEQAAKGALAT